MLPGVYQTRKKDGTIYFRSGITFRSKHISLGSFSEEAAAHRAYLEAEELLKGRISLEDILEAYLERTDERSAGGVSEVSRTDERSDTARVSEVDLAETMRASEVSRTDERSDTARISEANEAALSRGGGWEPGEEMERCLSFEKCVSLINYREHRMYIPTPIYMRKNYFSYFLSPKEELKFDIDDLFYYSQHKIMRRKGHLFVNDYGMQVTILSRFGLKSHAVCHRDYEFANGDPTDLRYSNIIVINRYHGVSVFEKNNRTRYRVRIHINGNYTVGTYSTEEVAAVAYNKAADLARKAGVTRSYPQNYVESLSASEYARIYTTVRLSKKYLAYLEVV